ncbi:MAG: aldehyde dehydrogenase family protein [Leptospirales bacterium]|nr:aldehyde dehydrogenase family protein [Leptospirales bacterium]
MAKLSIKPRTSVLHAKTGRNGSPSNGNGHVGLKIIQKGKKRFFEKLHPATLEHLGNYPIEDAAAVDQVLDKARSAFKSWSNLTLKARAKHLKNFRKQLVKDMEEVIDVICSECGKTEMDAIIEIFTVCEHMKYVEKKGPVFLADEERSTGLFANKGAYVSFLPRGVVGVISPWNYPLVLSVGPVTQALMAGNTVVLKPSEVTPRTSLKLAEIALRSGLPADVLHVITGDGSTGAALVESPKSDMICFTGSTATGRKIGEICGRMLKPVILELGGKAPMVVFDDANLQRAANGALWGGFSNSGQTCITVDRIFVQEKAYEEFVSLVQKGAAELRQGLRDETPSIGSMTFPKQIQIVEDHVSDARKNGATILSGGKKNVAFEGHFYEPTIVTDHDHSFKIMREETFGPVINIVPFKTEEEVVELANATAYGLNAYVWSKDMKRARRVARKVRSGNMNLNDVYSNYIISDLPFGGVKSSGLGKVYGIEGIRAFSDQQAVCVDRLGLSKELWWFPYSKGKQNLFRNVIRFLFG